MKKNSTATTSRNLESRFAAGQDVLDYFDAGRAITTHGGARPGAGRKPTGHRRQVLNLPPDVIRRAKAEAKKRGLTLSAYAAEKLAS